MLRAVGNIVDFKMYPYGNARVSGSPPNAVFSCQHGTNECIVNMWQACAIEHTNGTNTQGIPNWWAFVDCLESSRTPYNTNTAQTCANNNGVSWIDVSSCAGSNPAVGSATDGNPLMYSIAMDTNNLVPAHQWTPWVVMNGKPLSSAQLGMSLTSLVCNAYTGTPPSGCSKASAIPLSMNDW